MRRLGYRKITYEKKGKENKVGERKKRKINLEKETKKEYKFRQQIHSFIHSIFM
jgi:hypothetical protein